MLTILEHECKITLILYPMFVENFLHGYTGINNSEQGENIMKKSLRIISVLLALVMIVSLIPGMAFAADTGSDFDLLGFLTSMGFSLSDLGSLDLSKLDLKNLDLGSIMQLLTDLKLPTLVVWCVTNNNLPAMNATVTLTNQLNGETTVTQANTLGLALVPKGLTGVYTVSATFQSTLTGITYQALPGIKWTAGVKPSFKMITMYPILNIGLNYSDHFSYMVGYADGTVRPYGKITRAEAASMIFRIMTPEARDKFMTKTNSFRDVSKSNPHNNAISTLVNAGIINGYTATSFGPNDYITRGQFAAIIGRMFSVSYTGGNMFGDLNGDFSDNYINLLAQLGIMKGDGMGNANPNQFITRAQAAAMLNRLLGRMPEAHSFQACAKDVKQYPDNSSDAWYYADMIEATNSHYYTWSSDMSNIVNNDTIICEQWTSIRTDTPDWIALQK